MATIILAINIGSTSKRYTLFKDTTSVWHYYMPSNHAHFLTSAQHSIQVLQEEKNILPSHITALAFRVVAPGTYFTKHRIITPYYCSRLRKISMLVPVHTPVLIKEIEQFRRLLPDTRFIGISDSAFHVTLPQQAKLYGLPPTLAKKLDIYRFGYHGISVESVMRRLHSWPSFRVPERVIICHLGGGSSVTAVKSGVSIDTSMGFTPLEGPPMSSRSGTLDPAAVVYSAQKLNFTPDQMLNFLTTQCGFTGLADTSNMQAVIQRAEQGDAQAESALKLFVYCLIKYIGAYSAALGGLDCLVFTGTIGERSPVIRERICLQLHHMGIALHTTENNACTTGDGIISASNSCVTLAVVSTDEMNEINYQAQKLLSTA